MVDFRKRMTPEQREKWDKYRKFEAKQKQRYREMTDENLIVSTQYCMSQMEGPYKYGPGLPVYDAAFFHAIVPELLERLRTKSTTKDKDDEL